MNFQKIIIYVYEMNISLVQMEVIAGNPAKNFLSIKNIIEKAKLSDTDILVFPELCISGYIIGDLWEEQSFLDDCEYFGQQIAALSDAKLCIIFGNILLERNTKSTDGRILKFNAVFVAENGALRPLSFGVAQLPAQPKVLLPNYREFEESRHFKDLEWFLNHGKVKQNVADVLKPVMIKGTAIGLSICEDAWDRDYPVKPIDILSKNGAEIILNLSCSPFTLNKNIARDRTFSSHALQNNIPVLYVNSIGIQNNGKTIFTFDGSSVAYNKKGEIIASLPMFESGSLNVVFDKNDITSVQYTKGENNSPSEIEQIYSSLKFGIGNYLMQSGLKRVVIGVSGGIDSAVAAALYAEIVGKENLLLVNMPSKFNSYTTINLSEQLARNIGCWYTSMSIEDSVAVTKKQIEGLQISDKSGKSMTMHLESFVLENIQARDRSSRILAALAAAFGGVFTNNGNKTETCVGYCTLYGDHAGFLAAIADLWKYQVYALGRYLNRKGEIIPERIFDIQPSAELSEEQSLDKGKGDPIIYWYHDYLFKSWVENWNRITPTEILEWYTNGSLFENLRIENPKQQLTTLFPTHAAFIADLERWWKAFKGMGVAKRVQAPPVLAVTRRAFGFDYRESMNCVYYSRRYEELKRELLKFG